jgi:hypothetical protein
LQFENLAEQYEQLQKQGAIAEQVFIEVDEREQLKNTINNLMSEFDQPLNDLNKS